MSVANLKTKIMITAEEFFRNKIREQNPNREVVTLSQELITAEEAMRWAHEFKQLHLHNVVRQSEQLCQHKYQDIRYGTSRCVICGKEEQSF